MSQDTFVRFFSVSGILFFTIIYLLAFSANPETTDCILRLVNSPIVIQAV